MFTGLIADVGRLRARAPLEKGVRLEIETGLPMDEVAVGASIECHHKILGRLGVCEHRKP